MHKTEFLKKYYIDPKYLYEVDHSDGLGLIRAIEICRLRWRKSRTPFTLALKNRTRHENIAKEFLYVHKLPLKNYTHRDLETIQKKFNDYHGPTKLNIVLFSMDGDKKFKKLRPVFEGNPAAKYPVAILQFTGENKTWFYGIRNIGKAFNTGLYCLKCKKTVKCLKKHPCHNFFENKTTNS